MKNDSLNENENQTSKIYGNAHVETCENVDFILRDAQKYVVDDYDEELGSVELSHYEKAGYENVVDYYPKNDIEILNLTWMNPKDSFRLEENKRNQFIRQIIVNIDNLKSSLLSEGNFNDVELIVHNSNLNIVKQVQYLKSFLKHNASYLKSVKLEGYSYVSAKLLDNVINDFNLNNELSSKPKR